MLTTSCIAPMQNEVREAAKLAVLPALLVTMMYRAVETLCDAAIKLQAHGRLAAVLAGDVQAVDTAAPQRHDAGLQVCAM